MIKIETGDDIRESRSYTKTEFLNLELGEHRVRLLGEFFTSWVHYIPQRKATIACLGNECPICQNNKSLKSTNPENYKSMPGYINPSLRHYINVLDRTLVRVCPSCQTENKADLSKTFPGMCRNCGALITNVEPKPSNKVKVSNFSDTIATELKIKQMSTLDKEGNPIGLENMDLVITVIKSGGKKSPSIAVDTKATDKVEVPADALFDLTNCIIKLEPEETKHLLAGVSIKDIYAARRGNGNGHDETVTDEMIDSTQSKLDELFKN